MRGRAVILVIVSVLVAACTSATEPDVQPVNAPSLPFVVIGAGQSDGGGIDDELRSLWARRVFQDLPRRTVYVNLAREGATAASALEGQVPDAVDLEPTLVTIWLVSADAITGTPIEAFRRDLTALAAAFDPETDVVLVASWSDPERDGEEPYLEVVREVAAATPADLVDLSDLGPEDPDVQQEIADRVLAVARAG